MKQWLMYLKFAESPSLGEYVDQVYELDNDEEETSKGLLSVKNVGHRL